MPHFRHYKGRIITAYYDGNKNYYYAITSYRKVVYTSKPIFDHAEDAILAGEVMIDIWQHHPKAFPEHQ